MAHGAAPKSFLILLTELEDPLPEFFPSRSLIDSYYTAFEQWANSLHIEKMLYIYNHVSELQQLQRQSASATVIQTKMNYIYNNYIAHEPPKAIHERLQNKLTEVKKENWSHELVSNFWTQAKNLCVHGLKKAAPWISSQQYNNWHGSNDIALHGSAPRWFREFLKKINDPLAEQFPSDPFVMSYYEAILRYANSYSITPNVLFYGYVFELQELQQEQADELQLLQQRHAHKLLQQRHESEAALQELQQGHASELQELQQRSGSDITGQMDTIYIIMISTGSAYEINIGTPLRKRFKQLFQHNWKDNGEIVNAFGDPWQNAKNICYGFFGRMYVGKYPDQDRKWDISPQFKEWHRANDGALVAEKEAGMKLMTKKDKFFGGKVNRKRGGTAIPPTVKKGAHEQYMNELLMDSNGYDMYIPMDINPYNGYNGVATNALNSNIDYGKLIILSSLGIFICVCVVLMVQFYCCIGCLVFAKYQKTVCMKLKMDMDEPNNDNETASNQI